MSAKNPKKVFVYMPLGLQSEVRKVVDQHQLKSFSSGLRVLLRLAITTKKDLDQMGRDDVYQSFMARERGDD